MTDVAILASTDPTLAVAERQLVLLGELSEITMVAARAVGSSVVAAAAAEKQILSEEWFTPEVGRARACGAKDAAESLQKVSRAVRLTMKLEMAVAEIVRDIHAGIVTHSAGTVFRKGAGETPAVHGAEYGGRSQSRPAGLTTAYPSSIHEARDRDRGDADTEHLVEFDRPDILRGASFRATVDGLCADAGAKVDWESWTIEAPASDHRRRAPHLSLGGETRLAGSCPLSDLVALGDRELALSP